MKRLYIITIVALLMEGWTVAMAVEGEDAPGVWVGFTSFIFTGVRGDFDAIGLSLTYASKEITLSGAVGEKGYLHIVAMRRVGKWFEFLGSPEMGLFVGIYRDNQITGGKSKVGFGFVFGEITPKVLHNDSMGLRFFLGCLGGLGGDSIYGITLEVSL